MIKRAENRRTMFRLFFMCISTPADGSGDLAVPRTCCESPLRSGEPAVILFSVFHTVRR